MLSANRAIGLTSNNFRRPLQLYSRQPLWVSCVLLHGSKIWLMTKPSAHPPQKPKRRVPVHIRPALKEYGKVVGELLWAANTAQASFCDLFAALVDPDQLDAGMSIWFTIQTDRAQLNTLTALTKVRLAPHSRAGQSIAWAASVAGKLAEIRNDAAHMAMSPSIGPAGPELVPNFLANPPSRLARREGKDFLGVFRQATGDYIQLQQYVHDVFCHLAYPAERFPLPLRPVLKSAIARRTSMR